MKKDTKTLIYHHLGLGDHLICNGLVRQICKNPGHFSLICKGRNIESVNFMYRDLDNFSTISVETDDDVPRLPLYIYDPIIKIGHEFLSHFRPFDTSFYHQLGCDFSERWNSFHVERDAQKESDLYKRLDLSSEYIFVHDDEERGMKIENLKRDGVKIIKASRELTPNIFDYLSVLENAAEIHCIDSSFLFLVDSFDFKGKLFNHRYARTYPPNNTPTLRKDWKILNERSDTY